MPAQAKTISSETSGGAGLLSGCQGYGECGRACVPDKGHGGREGKTHSSALPCQHPVPAPSPLSPCFIAVVLPRSLQVVALFISALSPAAAAGGGGGVGSGRVSYGAFVNALRFGSLPWRGYNAKLRHRVGGDPEQPFGPPSG